MRGKKKEERMKRARWGGAVVVGGGGEGVWGRGARTLVPQMDSRGELFPAALEEGAHVVTCLADRGVILVEGLAVVED